MTGETGSRVLHSIPEDDEKVGQRNGKRKRVEVAKGSLREKDETLPKINKISKLRKHGLDIAPQVGPGRAAQASCKGELSPGTRET